MSGRIIKCGTYIPISSEPFDMPVPIKFELMHMNTLLCVYSVAEDMSVDFSYNANTDIPILTPTDRRLTINDIYYLLRSRVFPDSPYTTPAALSRLGLKEYNPYEIVKLTHGIMPMNAYWIRRSDEDIVYNDAFLQYNELMFGSAPPPEEKTEQEGLEGFLGMGEN